MINEITEQTTVECEVKADVIEGSIEETNDTASEEAHIETEASNTEVVEALDDDPKDVVEQLSFDELDDETGETRSIFDAV